VKSVNFETQNLKESIFSTITGLALQHQAINLAQGFPDFEGPQWILDLAKSALDQGKNQYAPSFGIAPLREAIAAIYRHTYGLEFDPGKEIVVTNGATEAIYSTVRALLNPGDEVVAFEPLYDSYLASVQLAKGVLKPVTLKLPDFHFDVEELRRQITPRTKLLILNNPHNPTGRVFTRAELEGIARIAVENDLYVLSDEVYEYLTFDVPHIPIATLPGMGERTLTISSIGKTLSLTGWKIGWVCAPAPLAKAVHNIHQFISFCVAHPLQAALAQALPRLGEYLPQFRADYHARRDLLVGGLKELGFQVIAPQGTYFAIAQVPEGTSDVEYSQNLILTKKVATIPTSPFYIQSQEGKKLVRFCFAKKETTLKQALENLKGAR